MCGHIQFTRMTDLLAYAERDKECEGVGTAQLNRYPIRFLLFENFEDFREFLDKVNSSLPWKIYTLSVKKWMDEEFPDALVTPFEMRQQIVGFVKRLEEGDAVIAPFSEMARFYDNLDHDDFQALIRDIRIAEGSALTQELHHRIYIPIIGMQKKMGYFFNDPNIHIWELRPEKATANYQLILTPGTAYGVHGLEQNYSLCSNVKEWLGLWEKEQGLQPRIISSSKTLFERVHYAEPDNAFSYTLCHNAYEFLTIGLGLDFTGIVYREGDADRWERLAAQIDVNDFEFERFVNSHFGTAGINNEGEFVRAWFDCEDAFDYWLLAAQYLKKFGDSTYLGMVLSDVENLTTSELFSQIAVAIFGDAQAELHISQRRELMIAAARHGVTITDEAERRLNARLQAIATDPGKGYYAASKLLTPLTASEKRLMIEWIGRGNLELREIEQIYPELYRYLLPYPLKSTLDWLNPYMDAYRQSKIRNAKSDTLNNIIKEQNASPVKFHGWYDDIKTVKTFLNSRPDIEVVYWIDGLGVDWTPYIARIVERHAHDGIYLNEIYLSAAELPTRTENNKAHIQAVAGDRLEKIGDIDKFAHTVKSYPDYIIDELNLVTDAIEEVLSKYNGKKIAFVSDHGITYMSQLSNGLNMAGIEVDHAGRVARRTDGNTSPDDNYILLDDGKTLCALNHNSLGAKVQRGLGAHGGATPEEVLVPIIIVSGQKNASHITAHILTDEITGMNPVVEFKIQGLTSIDIPMVVYNGTSYPVKEISEGVYRSAKLNLADNCIVITLSVGDNFSKDFPIIVQTGAQEDDLFGDI